MQQRCVAIHCVGGERRGEQHGDGQAELWLHRFTAPAHTGRRAIGSSPACAPAARSLRQRPLPRTSGSRRCWRRATTALPSPGWRGSRDLGMALGVDVAVEAVPGLAHRMDAGHAPGVAMHEFVPQRASGARAVVPGHMVEPQQELSGTVATSPNSRASGGGVLRDRIAAGGAAIQSDAVEVGAVVVGRGPVRTWATCDPRPGAVVMPAPPSGDAGPRGVM
jgi:hypothetical protein